MKLIPALIAMTIALSTTFGWITADLAEKSGRNRVYWFCIGLILGPFGLFAILITARKYICRSCHQKVEPLIGLCPSCFNQLEQPRQRIHIPE